MVSVIVFACLVSGSSSKRLGGQIITNDRGFFGGWDLLVWGIVGAYSPHTPAVSGPAGHVGKCLLTNPAAFLEGGRG